MKNTRHKRYVFDYSVSYNTINVSNIEDIRKYLMKNTIFHKCQDSLSNRNGNGANIKF